MLIDKNKADKILGAIAYIIVIIIVFMMGVFVGGIYQSSRTGISIVSAEDFKKLSVDEIDQYYNNIDIRITDATVEEIVTSASDMWIKTDIGSVFFEDPEDVYKVREGETFTFIGNVDLQRDDGKIIFHHAEFIPPIYEK